MNKGTVVTKYYSIFLHDTNMVPITCTITKNRLLSEVSQDTPNYNCTLLNIVTMLNMLHDRYFAGYAQTQANCNAMFDV